MIVLVLLPTTSWAQSAAEQIAARAQRAHEQHCANVAGSDDEGAAARSISEVGAVWAEVAEVHKATGASWLLYWRGVLAQCLDQDERAADALIGFVESDPTSAGMGAMVRDAENRLSRLRPDYAPPKPAKVPPTPEQRRRTGEIGAGLALGAAGAGAGSGVGFGQFSATRAAVNTTVLTTSEIDGLIVQGDGQIAAGIGLALGAGVAAVASIAAFARKSPRGAEVAVVPVPMAAGAGLVVGGRW